MASQFFVSGYVKFTPSDKPVSGVKIEIWEQHVPYGYLSGGSTDNAGKFSCFINETIATLMETPGEIELKYIVKYNGNIITEAPLTGSLISPIDILISPEVYDLAVPMMPPVDTISYALLKIKGTVYDVAGMTCADRSVDIYEISFREKKLLTSTRTNKNGIYATEINTRFFGSNVDAKRTIRVEIKDGEDIIGKSDDILNLNGEIVANITISVYDEACEFTTLSSQVQAIIGTATIDSLVIDEEAGIDEIKYVANATGISENIVIALVYAYKYATTTLLPADILFALLKITGDRNNPLDTINAYKLPAIVNLAIETNTILAYSSTDISSFVTIAAAIQLENIKNTEIVGEIYTINDLITAIVEVYVPAMDVENTVDLFLNLQLQEFGTVEEIFDEFASVSSAELAEQIRKGLRVAAMANYMPPITNKILIELGTGHVSKLAEYTVIEWVALISDVCLAESRLCVPAGLRGENTDPSDGNVHELYARRLASVTQAVFPLANILRFLQGVDGNTIISDNSLRTQVIAFLDNNRNFDSRATSIVDINNVDYNLTDVVSLEELYLGLEGIARVSRVAGGNPFAIIKLLQDGITSATQIASLGWDLFSETYEYLFSPVVGSPAGPCATQEVVGLVPNVSEAYDRAVKIANNISSALGGVVPSVTNAYTESPNGESVEVIRNIQIGGTGISYPHALPVGGVIISTSGGYPSATSPGGAGTIVSSAPSFSLPFPAPQIGATTGFETIARGTTYNAPSLSSSLSLSSPTLAALFGSLDYTICNDCKSLYGPGAYLADTLHFLKTENPVLYAKLNDEDRRPDIKYIDLTCDNTNTSIPYIDIVNELLETKVLKRASLPVPTNISLATRNISKISMVEKTGVSTIEPSVAGSFNVSQALVKPTQKKIISSGLSKSVDNNIQVFANVPNTQQVTSPRPMADASTVNIPSSKVNTQSAYPERLYRDRNDDTSVNPYKDFNAYTIPTTSRTTYEKVYEDILPLAVYPNKLPYNIAIDETRVYFHHFGTSRLEMMKLFRPINPSTATPPPSTSITEYTICSEFLGISQTTASIIDGTHVNYGVNAHLFYGANTANMPNYINPIDGTIMTGTATDAWQNNMSARIDVLIQQAGISYNELLQFLSTSYLNPLLSGSDKVRRIGIKPHTGEANDTPKLNLLKLVFNTSVSGTAITSVETASAINATWVNFSPNFYKKLHSFVRLYRAANISIYHFDILFRSMMLPATSGITDAINTMAYKQVANILKLANELNIQPEVLAMWWNNADTVNYINYPNNSSNLLTSVYQDIFNNKSVINNSVGNIFANPDASVLDNYDYGANTAHIANVCGIKEFELIQMLAFLNVPLNGVITLPVLSRLYILSVLTQNLQISVADFIDLLNIANISVSTANITTSVGSGTLALDTYISTLQRIIDIIRAASISGFNVAEIKYLVAETTANNRNTLLQDRIRDFFETIRFDLSKLPIFIDERDSIDEIVSEKSRLYFNRLSQIVYQNFCKEFGVTIEEARKILDITKSGPEDDGVIGDIIKEKFVTSTYNLHNENIQFIDDFNPILLDENGRFPETYVLSGVTMQTPTDVVGNYQPEFHLERLCRAYTFFHKVALIYLRLSLKEKEFAYLFDSMNVNTLNFKFSDLPVYQGGVDLKNIAGNTVSKSALFEGILRLSRIMDLAELIDLREDGLRKLLETQRGVNINIVNETPVFFGATSEELNAGFTNLLNILKNGDTDSKLDELLGNYTTGAGNITKQGSSGPDSLLSVKFAFGSAGDFNFGVYRNISMIIDAISLVAKCKLIGLQPSSLVMTLTENVSVSAVRPLVLSANSNYSVSDWEKVSKTLRDPLRIAQRDAMVAYLRKKPNDLFAEMLLDPEMSPCMMTSRIKQAISSVQLFVDRVMLGLEKSGTTVLSLTNSSINQWQNWRKWYRIWEANRKVFFYPEDWMQPELRDDKTPFFIELEEELKQNSLTMDSAERAIANYLLKLDEVAKLEPVGNCEQTTANTKNITHVFARTHGNTRVYYHRKLVQNTWTAWEKIDLQIEGEHVVPFVWNNKLYLFWLSFIEKGAPFTANMRAIVPSSIPDNYKEWFWNYTDDIDVTVATSTSSPNNMYRKLEVYINWAEYRNGEWKNTNRSSDSITLNINPFIEQIIKGGNGTAQSIFRELRNANSQDILSFIKSRIFLYPHVHDTAIPADGNFNVGVSGSSYNFVKGDLYMMLTFPTFKGAFTTPSGGSTTGSLYSEYADYIKAFHFPLSSNHAKVLSDSLFFKRVNPAFGSYFKNQAFVSIQPGFELSKFNNRNLLGSTNDFYNHDGLPKRISVAGTRVMTLEANATTLPQRIITSRTSNYRIVPESGYKQYPLDRPFFFEDSANIFFVSKTYYTNYFQSGNYKPISGIAAISAAGLDGINSKRISSKAYFPSDLFSIDISSGSSIPYDKYYFQPFYHHHSHLFRRMINQYGAKGLYRPDQLGLSGPIPVVQAANEVTDDTIDFRNRYSYLATAPNIPSTPEAYFANVNPTFPKNNVDFKYDGAYSMYNWELFFHIPMLIAQRLSENMQFFEAQKWYHYIFDPTSANFLNNETPVNGNQKYWKFYPFYKTAELTSPPTLELLMKQIREASGTPGTPASGSVPAIPSVTALNGEEHKSAKRQIDAYKERPFEPFVLGRLRPVAFMKYVVAKYIDNLIAWGDNLFSRDTLESINEATQIYIMASNLLGKRPTTSVQRVSSKPMAYVDFINSSSLDLISQASVKVENYLSPSICLTTTGAAPYGFMNYFCMMPNEKLLEYWDIVEDRLFKIRNCQNLQGIVQNRSLFDTPIDPSALVQGVANGMSMDEILNSITNVNKPLYRFNYLLQKAHEFVADVKALGGALLSAMEKRDAEELALIRQGQEIAVQNTMLQIKKKQIDEARANYDALVKTRDNAQLRVEHFNNLINSGLSNLEKSHISGVDKTINMQDTIATLQTTAQFLSLIPTFSVKLWAAVGPSFGGGNLAAAASGAASVLSNASQKINMRGSLISTLGGYERREQDWKFQKSNAEAEVALYEKQIIAADVRIKIAETDYKNQQLQIDNSLTVEAYMKVKYTNKQLYDWMVNQISSTYRMAYNLAYDMAVKAHDSFKWELPQSAMAKTNLVLPVWDSRKKGLLAGEMLQADLRNMEMRYIEDNQRVYELTRHVSLAQLDPVALAQLRLSGYCEIQIPEEWYDMDFPGHVNRTIKTVSLSIPCVSGPYATIPCTLSLQDAYRRLNATADLVADQKKPACTRIAFTSGQNDGGLFEVNMRDERYLPFEGAGAVSNWAISLFNAPPSDRYSTDLTPPSTTTFDLDSISDVILHIRYTAQDSNSVTFNTTRRGAVNDFLAEPPAEATVARLFSLKHDFYNEWYNYTSSIETEGAALSMQLTINHFPLFCGNKTVKVTGIRMVSRLNDPADTTAAFGISGTTVASTGGTSVSIESVTDIVSDAFSSIKKTGGTTDLSADNINVSRSVSRNFSLTFDPATYALINKLRNVYFIVTYQLV